MAGQNYAKEQDIKYTKLIRHILRQLPEYCTDYMRAIENNTETRTRAGYAGDLLRFFTFLTELNPALAQKAVREISLEDLSSLQRVDIEEYLELLKGDEASVETANQKVTIARKLSSLKGLFAYLYSEDKISENPVAKIKAPKIAEKEIVWLEEDEISKLLDLVESGTALSGRAAEFHKKLGPRDLAIVTLLLGTGIRVSELVGINLDDLDMEHAAIRVHRKGGRDEFVFFGEEVRSALMPYLEYRKKIIPEAGSEDAFFLSIRRRRICVRSVEVMVKKYALGAAPLKQISPHKLRSSYATSLLRETGDISLVSECLGHKSIETTRRRYAVVDREKRYQARNSIKLRS